MPIRPVKITVRTVAKTRGKLSRILDVYVDCAALSLPSSYSVTHNVKVPGTFASSPRASPGIPAPAHPG